MTNPRGLGGAGLGLFPSRKMLPDGIVKEKAEASLDQITKIQELVYELEIGDVMKFPVVTVTPDMTMIDLRETLRKHSISGTPVMEAGRLVGIVSIEDLLKAMAEGAVETPVKERMTRNVVTVCERESVIEAVRAFSERGVGRLPVVDPTGRLTGILTGGDITRGLLEAIGLDYHKDEIQRYRASHIFEDIVSDDTSLVLRYVIPSRDFIKGGEASSKIRRALDRLGADPQTVRRVGIAAYEAEMNILIHTTQGGELSADIQPGRVTVLATDTGPGIEDVDQAMAPGFSTAPEWIRELGFGAGMGLQNIRKYSDEMRLTSELGRGTRLEITVHLPFHAEPSEDEPDLSLKPTSPIEV